MRQLTKIFLCAALLGAGLMAAWGFVGIQPVGQAPDTWQTTANGFNPYNAGLSIPFGISSPLSTGPAKIGQAYRPNSTVWFYAPDASFIDYFGSNGVAAVDQAFTILNNSFSYTNAVATNGLGVDGYSPMLSEAPDYSQHRNTTAYGLGLTDLKSTLLWMMTPYLGLEQPDRYVWTLFQAYLPTGQNPPAVCPDDEEFVVGQRNLGYFPGPLNQPPLVQYSPYINDELYTYEIYIGPNCAPAAGYQPTFMVENFPADPFGLVDTPVASWGLESAGGFYTSLTRDDLAGLRYNLTTNRVNYESPAAGALMVTTNMGGWTLLTTSNLNTLLTAVPTNDPATFATLFPDVTLAGTVTNYSIVTNWNVVFGTNYLYGSPYGSSVGFVSSNIDGTAWQFTYQDTFGNVITNGNLHGFPGVYLQCPNLHLDYKTNTAVSIVTVMAYQPTGAPYPTVVTNSFTNTIVVAQPSGEYFVLPASQCGWQFVSCDSAYSVQAVSNSLPIPTNSISTSTNYAAPVILSQYSLTYFTNHTFLVQPITCTTTASTTNTAGFYQGIEKMQFVRADFDSLTGQTFRPVTNNYSMVMVNTNGQLVTQHFQRVVTAPDVTISAADMTPVLPTFNAETLSGPNFTPDAGYGTAAGPGTINPPVNFVFNKVGDIYVNGSLSSFSLTTNQFLSEATQPSTPILAWASFGANTNPPIVYPNSADLQNLAYQMVTQVMPSPPNLPDASTTSAVNIPFSSTGGPFTKPYNWSATGLPSGLRMVSNSDSTGTLTGTPSQTGTFDITVQMTDNVGRSVQWNYAITIH
jgi:hypothetical protein